MFNPNADSAQEYLGDPEFLILRRHERLLALEILYINLAALEERAGKWKEAAGRHVWVLTRVLERAKIPSEVLEAINIEQQVNMMDPDFSFAEWLKNHAAEQEQQRQRRGQ